MAQPVQSSASSKPRSQPMATCDACGNEYDKAMQISVGGRSLTFDCFECAIHYLAPICGHCGCRIIGHGVESKASVFCCAHCARQAGEAELQDRVAPTVTDPAPAPPH